MKKSILTATLVMSLTGCYAGVASPVPGFLFAKVKAAQTGSASTGATKSGKATCESILGLIATGDCSIEAAKANGGLTTVQYSDVEVKNILGVYAEYTTHVRGQ